MDQCVSSIVSVTALAARYRILSQFTSEFDGTSGIDLCVCAMCVCYVCAMCVYYVMSPIFHLAIV